MQQGEIRYSRTHEWARIEDGNIASVGITDFALQQLSDLVYIGLPKIGQPVKSEAPFGEVESVKAVSDLNAPLSGEVVEINENIVSNLGSINKDNWLIKIKLGHEKESEWTKLLSEKDYDKLKEAGK
ncbi:MAG: glycine cleavage system protein GcvH [Planctomycetes bacterium]|nr:glycine cleavage system protein GcvH [Planctomycetota bacterium]